MKELPIGPFFCIDITEDQIARTTRSFLEAETVLHEQYYDEIDPVVGIFNHPAHVLFVLL